MILIIDFTKKDGPSLAEMFHYIGIPAYSALPTEAAILLSELHNCIIAVEPDSFTDIEDYILPLRALTKIPIFVLTDNETQDMRMIFDGTIKIGTYAPKILQYISEYSKNSEFDSLGNYKLDSLNASINLPAPTYRDSTLPLTKTETMILRVLITYFPNPTSTKTILNYAFRQTKFPELSNIRTHVSVINKKFRECVGKNIITSDGYGGYKIEARNL